ncbi:MAG: VOC family protein [Acidobacteria bacterium]|nr:VOC family protein [Acidobacteriota bacterium]
MITHVKTVTIYVSDQQEALRFYTDKLGFEVRRSEAMGPNWIIHRSGR